MKVIGTTQTGVLIEVNHAELEALQAVEVAAEKYKDFPALGMFHDYGNMAPLFQMIRGWVDMRFRVKDLEVATTLLKETLEKLEAKPTKKKQSESDILREMRL